jgi:hypothetical protein
MLTDNFCAVCHPHEYAWSDVLCPHQVVWLAICAAVAVALCLRALWLRYRPGRVPKAIARGATLAPAAR